MTLGISMTKVDCSSKILGEADASLVGTSAEETDTASVASPSFTLPLLHRLDGACKLQKFSLIQMASERRRRAALDRSEVAIAQHDPCLSISFTDE